jgi:hypothetical protein
LLVAAALLMAGFGVESALMPVLVWAVAATTLGSGAAYVWRAARGR